MSIILPKEVTTVIEYFLDSTSTWTDITDLVVSDIDVEQGISDDSYDNRLADPAVVTFQVNNSSDYFTTVNFHKNTLVRGSVTYNGRTRTKFFGQLAEIDFSPGTKGDKRLHVTVTDWLDYTLNQFVRNRPVESGKRTDEGILGLINESPIQPVNVLIESGNTVYPTIFDEVDRNTTIYREMNKLIMSEYGYGYMDEGGERFRVENKNSRSGIIAVKKLPMPSDGSALLKADGDYLLKADGDKILLNLTQDADFDTSVSPEVITNIKVVHGKHILNEIDFVAFPKTLDATPQVVYSLPHDAPIFIPALGTVVFEGFFSDPRGGGSIGATDFEELIDSSDYFAYEFSDETGTDYTANITITPTYYADRVKFEVTNSDVGAWLTHLNLRAIGIYPDNPISYVAADAHSRDTYGVHGLSIVQPYQHTLDLGSNEAEKILDQEREARDVATIISCVANASDLNMQAFLHLDIGDLIHIKTVRPAVDSNYFIQGMRWKIDWATKVIYYTYILKEFPTLTPIAIEFMGQAGAENGIDFGLLPVATNLQKQAYTVWVYNDGTDFPIMGKYAGTASNVLYKVGDKIRYLRSRNITDGMWITTNDVLASGVWTHVALTYNSLQLTQNGNIYIDGVAQTVTEESSPDGALDDDTNIKFIIANTEYPGGTEWQYNPKTVIKDARVYNRFLFADEILEIAQGENDYGTVPVGLVFQAPFVRNFRVADYVDNVITNEMKVFDRVTMTAGTPHYDVTSSGNYIYGRDPEQTSY